MADKASGADDPVGAEPLHGLRDAQMLKEAMHEATSTSPEAFLMTIDDIKAKEADYWEREISSSTWAVIQKGDKVVGFAVARWPDGEMDRDVDPTAARFIESVWIDPKLRRQRLAEQLVRFLFEVERAKSPGVGHFLLWVFDKNYQPSACTSAWGSGTWPGRTYDQSGRTELRYEYRLEPDARGVRAAALAARLDDLRTARPGLPGAWRRHQVSQAQLTGYARVGVANPPAPARSGMWFMVWDRGIAATPATPGLGPAPPRPSGTDFPP